MRKIRCLAYELYTSGALGGSLGASRKDVQGGGCRFGDGQIFPHKSGKLCYTTV